MAQVLVVEDDDDIRRGLTLALGDAGFEVIEAETGDAASWLMEIEHPELLLAGMHIRGRYNGVSLATLTRTRHPGLPVLFVMNRPGDIKHMADFAQPFAAVARPCLLAEIVAAAQRLVSRGGRRTPVARLGMTPSP